MKMTGRSATRRYAGWLPYRSTRSASHSNIVCGSVGSVGSLPGLATIGFGIRADPQRRTARGLQHDAHAAVIEPVEGVESLPGDDERVDAGRECLSHLIAHVGLSVR